MRNIKGITLIALIVTIIILLLLAGITISFLTSDNGILMKAIDARKAHQEAEQKENNDLNIMNKQSDKYLGISDEKPSVFLNTIVKVGDYIDYNDLAKWRVIENSESAFRIISEETSIKQVIGNTGSSTSLSYSTAVNGLNQLAINNVNSEYAISARSAQYSDVASLNTLNMLNTGEAYWIANTYTYGNQYHVGVIDENGSLHQNTYNDPYSLVGWNATQYGVRDITHDARIIVTLYKNVMTNEGNGNIDFPFQLINE